MNPSHSKVLFLLTLSILSSCAVVQTKYYDDLPTKAFSPIIKTQITNPIIVKYKEAINLKSNFCTNILWVWGNANAKENDLIKKLKEEAIKNNAELVLRSDLRYDNSNTQSFYIGYGISQSSPISLPILDAKLCHYSKVQLGARIEKNGIISYVNYNSPASKVGLKEGMKVLKLNETFVPDNEFAVDLEIRVKNPGDKVAVEYMDLNGKKNKSTVTLEPI